MEIQDAPVFKITEKDYKNPLEFIATIRKYAEEFGICKIQIEDFQPPFVIDRDKFRFTPRMQCLNELDAKSRIKILFCNQIAKFWKFHGIDMVIPEVEKRPLDFYALNETVDQLGGYELITKSRNWTRLALDLNYNRQENGYVLKRHYEKYLQPFLTYINQVPASKAKKPNQNWIVGRSKEMNLSKCKNLDVTMQETCNLEEQQKFDCKVCGSDEENSLLLLCDTCDEPYHTYCLVPVIQEVPKQCEWTCPKCLRNGIYSPKDGFGFEDSPKDYSINEFQKMADQFKSNYFDVPEEQVSWIALKNVEKEFWRITSKFDEDVTVQYGSDLHTLDHGSGFPTDKKNKEYKKYALSKWNLNNLPLVKDCALSFLPQQISGIKVPWLYIGMVFSAFCWHIEDHWTYSISYMHFGEPKTWYSVPGRHAERFEEVIQKKLFPELFSSEPDLLHQLVTIVNPRELLDHGIPIYRVHQGPGEFVVTFPRSYHAGFNQGMNCAEAVNFGTGDWLEMGRNCLENYSNLKRFCVFSQDELIVKMAIDIKMVSPSLITSCFNDFIEMFSVEQKARRRLFEWGVSKSECVSLEILPDDARKCEICNTTLFLSAITCMCNRDVQVCLRHSKELCSCPAKDHILKYKYTLDEITSILRLLAGHASHYKRWLKQAKLVVDPPNGKKISFAVFEKLIQQALEKNYMMTKSLLKLEVDFQEAKKCVILLKELKKMVFSVKTRKAQGKQPFKISLKELDDLVEHVNGLKCQLDDFVFILELQQIGYEYKVKINKFLDGETLETSDPGQLKALIQQVEDTVLLFPELQDLKARLKQAEWMSKYKHILETKKHPVMEALQQILDDGMKVPPHFEIEKELKWVQDQLQRAKVWENCAHLLMNSPDFRNLQKLEEILDAARNVHCFLPTHSFLNDVFAFEYQKFRNDKKEEEANVDICDDSESSGDYDDVIVSSGVSQNPGISQNPEVSQNPGASQNLGIFQKVENPMISTVPSISGSAHSALQSEVPGYSGVAGPSENVEVSGNSQNIAPKLLPEPAAEIKPRKRGRPPLKPEEIAAKKNKIKKQKRVEQRKESTDDADDEVCCHPSCKTPFGSAIHWIQCENKPCSKWFHMACVGLNPIKVAKIKKYVCFMCKSKAKKQRQNANDLDFKLQLKK